MYDTFEKILQAKGLTAYKVAKETGLRTSTLSSWKQGIYTPKKDKLKKIADFLCIDVATLEGNLPEWFNGDTICPFCHIVYNPMDRESNARHDKIHNRFVYAEKTFGNILSVGDAEDLIKHSISVLLSDVHSADDKREAYDTIVRCETMLCMIESEYDISPDDAKQEGILRAKRRVQGLPSANSIYRIVGVKNVPEPMRGLTTGKDGEKESEEGNKYYFNDETAALAQELFERREMRVLFDAARDASPEDIQQVADILSRMRPKEEDM